MEPVNGDFNESTNEVKTLHNDELNEILDGSPTAPQFLMKKT